MEEAENQEVNDSKEIVTPSAEIQQEAPVQVVEQKPAEDADWIKNLRRGHKEALKRAEELERKNKMQEELMQKLMQQQMAPQQAAAPIEEDIIEQLAKEEYVPGEKAAKGLQKIKAEFKKELEEVKKMYSQKQYVDQVQELKREFPDLEEVVNPETLAIIAQRNPRAAQVWRGLDDYSIYVNAYPIIKASGILEEMNGTKRSKEVEKKIEQNKKTVQTPQAFDKRPIAQAFKLTEDEKKKLADEMYHYANMVGGGY